MAANTVSQIASADKGKELNFVEKNGEILFTAEEVGRHLGYSNPQESINRLYLRNQNELKLYAVPVRLTGTDGKSYEYRAFTEEGVYIISMLARTSQAKKFRARVALLLRRLRQEAIRRAAEQARLDTADLALSLSPEGRKQMLKALGYRKRGFTYREIAKLMDSHQRTVGNLLRTARKLGLEV